MDNKNQPTPKITSSVTHFEFIDQLAFIVKSSTLIMTLMTPLLALPSVVIPMIEALRLYL